MLVLVTGSRHARWDPHGKVVRSALLWATGSKDGKPGEDHVLWDGWANGVDQICNQIAHEDFGWGTKRFPADWSRCDESWVDPIDKAARCTPEHRKWRTSEQQDYCPTAGFRRNQLMVDSVVGMEGRKVVAGFPMPSKGSRGTIDCLTRALCAGLPVLSVPLK